MDFVKESWTDGANEMNGNSNYLPLTFFAGDVSLPANEIEGEVVELRRAAVGLFREFGRYGLVVSCSQQLQIGVGIQTAWSVVYGRSAGTLNLLEQVPALLGVLAGRTSEHPVSRLHAGE